MAIVGAFARVEIAGFNRCVAGLDAVDGVSTFPLDAPGKVGLLIEAGSLEDAHRIITKQIPTVQGVLGVWPVYASAEEEEQTEVAAAEFAPDEPTRRRGGS